MYHRNEPRASGAAKPTDAASEGLAPMNENSKTTFEAPDPRIAFLLHELKLPDEFCSLEQKQQAKLELMDSIEKYQMLPLYLQLCSELDWPVEKSITERLQKANEQEEASIKAKLDDAIENLGDVEVKDCLLARAHFLYRIGNFNAAVEAYNEAYRKTVGSGSRLDITLTLLRLGILFKRRDLVKQHLDKARAECDAGGDWERRNRFKVYNALELIHRKQFNEATKLLLDCIAVFSAYEVTTYENIIFLAVILGMMCLKRPELHAKVIKSPEVLQVLNGSYSNLKSLLFYFYEGQYGLFLESLVKLYPEVAQNFYFAPHARYFVRVVRLNAFRQFLEPFQAVTLKSMSEAFCLPEEVVEEDVTDFICNGKLSCKIDRVAGVVECSRPDLKHTLYLEAVRKGDTLLAKVQKLSKIIDM